MEQKVTVNFDNAKIKVEERSRGRMKITIKLSREEAEGFKNFSSMKPEEVSEEQFHKHIFFVGCKTLNEEIQQLLMEQKAKLEAQKSQTEGKNEVIQPSDIQDPPEGVDV